MRTFFWWDYNVHSLLFPGYDIQTVGAFAATCLGMLALAVFSELIKVVQVQRQRKQLLLRIRETQSLSNRSLTEDTVLIGGKRGGQASSTVSIMLVIEVLLGLNQWLGYMLMLIVMTYNGWFMISIVLGSSLGYFLCGATFNEISYENKKLVQESFCDLSCASSSQEIEHEPSTASTSTESTAKITDEEQNTVADVHYSTPK